MSESDQEPFEVTKSAYIDRRQESEVPEINLLENWQNLFYSLAKVTRASLLPGSESYRPLALRTRRAQIFKQIKSNWHTDEARTSIDEAKIRDKIAFQYLDQEDISIEFAELGEQRARFNIIRPPEEVNQHKDPIFLIPGISNDIDAVGWLAQELAYQGRKVITIAFPESFLGSVTEEFANAVENTDSYEPHTSFFMEAISKLTADDNSVELWGFSTGGAIAAEMLQKKALQDRISKAVLMCPASSADMSAKQLNFGMGKDGLYLAKNLSDSTKYTYTKGRKELLGIEPELEGQRSLKERIFNRLLVKVRTKRDSWKAARVTEGGEIVIVSGGQDDITRSRETFNDKDFVRNSNPQARLIYLPKLHHVSPLIKPEEVVGIV
ncbi:MAG: alpha/beta hydrolase [Patescibacteria group bacterium]